MDAVCKAVLLVATAVTCRPPSSQRHARQETFRAAQEEVDSDTFICTLAHERARHGACTLVHACPASLL